VTERLDCPLIQILRDQPAVGQCQSNVIHYAFALVRQRGRAARDDRIHHSGWQPDLL
jgi:hypothetical protein